jgi:hypothetical protein
VDFINIDEVAHFNIRKYSENLSISIFPCEIRRGKKTSLYFVFFFTREDIEAEWGLQRF